MNFKPNYYTTIEIARSLVAIEEKKELFKIDTEFLRLFLLKKDSNYHKALAFIEKKKEAKLTELIINSIHSILINGDEKSLSYRNKQNVIRDSIKGDIIYLPPVAKDIKPLILALVQWVNLEIEKGKIPILIIASIVHYQIATIHPYFKGNGKTARLTAFLLLIKHGYDIKGLLSLEAYFMENRTFYYQSLAIEKKLNYYIGRVEADISNFISYSLQAQLDVLLKENSLNKIEITKENLRELDVNQKKIFQLYNDYKELTNDAIAKKLKINKRSAAHLVKKWMAIQFLTIGNPSNKMRTYKLHSSWEKYLIKTF